jgi:hypothetical protein
MVSCRRFANRLFGQRALHVPDIFDKIKTEDVNGELKQQRCVRRRVCKPFISNAKAIARETCRKPCLVALRSARLCAWIASEASKQRARRDEADETEEQS